MSVIRISVLLCCAAFGLAAQDAAKLARKAMGEQQAGDLNAAAKDYAELLKIVPDDVATHVNYGIVLVHLERYDEAIRQYEAAEKLAPGDTRIELNLALAYQKSGKQAEALKAFESLHERDPGNERISLLLADSYLQAGRYRDILAVLQPFKNSSDLGIAYLMATALLRERRVSEAKTYLDRVTGSGDSPEVHYLLGIQASEASDFPSAVKELALAAERGPNLAGVQSILGHALLNVGDPDGALQAFDKALKENAQDAGALREKGEILLARRQYGEAEPLIRRASALLPEDPQTNLALAEVLLHGGKPADARRYAKKAAETNPDDIHAHQVLAAIYRRQGLHQQAATEDAAADHLMAVLDPGPSEGQMAPDFQLSDPVSGKSVHLADYRGKRPVVLVFGSYSCPNFRDSAEALKQLEARYGRRAPFLLIYIHEAHATGQWQSGRNVREDMTLPPPATMAEKQAHATMCSRKLHLPFPALVDGMDGSVESAYRAWPSRVFVVDAAGKIALSTRLGELDFQPGRMQAVLERVTIR